MFTFPIIKEEKAHGAHPLLDQQRPIVGSYAARITRLNNGIQGTQFSSTNPSLGENLS
jgi:hypothetical protein